ncbi:Alpha actinin sarcomeric [Fasciola hepatica]|uniref:Alpha actinin sarcomeric n=1 Tax=Fasciola hepatica TaxID=6192 RepID=A0A4E0RCJ4_FASHE|nr:Alpha actinin sarcomeric [Fasciola hepatica]
MMDYGHMGYVDGYYQNDVQEEEEEWDREAYLDPMWEIQQKKTFTAWCNSYLRKIGTSITNIEEDFQDGLKLIQLLETLSDEGLPKPDRGRMRFHKLANVNKALEYIESKGVQLVSIGAEEIVDGNIKMTLGMIWTIILRFCIQDITVEEMSAKEGLLLWCQRKTSPYKNVNVQNFHMSWKDGLAFCALIHRHRPDLIDYAKLSRDNPIHNLNYAFDVAEKHLDIPRMLDAEDMVNTVRPDERSVMTYVSAYYHAFAGAHKAESAANRISKVLQSSQENEKLMEQYEGLASDLLKWISKRVLFLKDRTTDGTIPGTCAKLNQYRDYRRGEKPPRLEDKCELENLFNTLQTRLRLANRPAFLPTEGKMISDIDGAWRQLENYEKGFEEWLLSEIKRLEEIEHLARKFRLKCATHEAWTEGKAASLESRDYEGASLSSLRAMAQKHDAFEADLGAHQSRVERIVAIAEELNSLNYVDVDSVNKQTARIVNEWDRLGQLSQRRREGIHKVLDVLNQIDKLQMSFAKRISTFNNWLEQAHEDLQDMFIVNKVEDITALLNGHENFKKTLPTAEKELREMISEARQVQELIQLHNLPSNLAVNPYTYVDYQTLESRWDAMCKLIGPRDQELRAELARQEQHEQLRRQFAQLANRAGPHLERLLDAVHSVLSTPNVVLEDQLRQLQKLEEDAENWRPNLAELERCFQSVQEARITYNPHTRYTMDTLRVGWEQLRTNLKRAQNEIENQILARDSRGVSEKQIDECRRCFNHFDRQRTRRLEPLDFRACLVSLGYNIPKTPQGEADFARIMRTVDPNRTGFVTFDSFMHFMTQQTTEADTAEKMVESFRTMAGDTPYITAEQLRRELPPEQAEYCISRMKAYKGSGEAYGDALDYTKFATALYGESEL